MPSLQRTTAKEPGSRSVEFKSPIPLLRLPMRFLKFSLMPSYSPPPFCRLMSFALYAFPCFASSLQLSGGASASTASFCPPIASCISLSSCICGGRTKIDGNHPDDSPARSSSDCFFASASAMKFHSTSSATAPCSMALFISVKIISVKSSWSRFIFDFFASTRVGRSSPFPRSAPRAPTRRSISSRRLVSSESE